jgi:tRNA A37 threonylcarbamoyltransferase TsaD
MSWTLSVPITPRADLDAAVDEAQAYGQDAPGVDEAVNAAKAAAKQLAPLTKRDFVSVNLSGHVLQPDEGDNCHDGITVSLVGYPKAAI